MQANAQALLRWTSLASLQQCACIPAQAIIASHQVPGLRRSRRPVCGIVARCYVSPSRVAERLARSLVVPRLVVQVRSNDKAILAVPDDTRARRGRDGGY